MGKVKLLEKAHCRFGDKGDTGLFVLVPYRPAEYDALAAVVTPSALSHHFGNLPENQITIAPCPQLGALVIAMRNSLGGGVTRSLALDIHGKTRSSHLLGMVVDWPEGESGGRKRRLSLSKPDRFGFDKLSLRSINEQIRPRYFRTHSDAANVQ